MTKRTMLVLSDALRYEANLPARHWVMRDEILTHDCHMSVAEVEETIRLLADGRYRQDGWGKARIGHRMVEGTMSRIRDGVDRFADALRPADARRDGPRAAASLEWVVVKFDEEHKRLLEGIDVTAAAINATKNARIADRRAILRMDEAIAALIGTSMGDREMISCLMPSPWSPAVVTAYDGLRWSRVPVDPQIEALMPNMLIVEGDTRLRGSRDASQMTMHVVHRIMRRDRCPDPMQAMRILSALATDPIA